MGYGKGDKGETELQSGKLIVGGMELVCRRRGGSRMEGC